ncbi:MAG: hypothetical protein JWO86_8686 [Myxococcaceae bacterium]|nr:hypothetical protein [Myxococcaceae bacterium]
MSLGEGWTLGSGPGVPGPGAPPSPGAPGDPFAGEQVPCAAPTSIAQIPPRQSASDVQVMGGEGVRQSLRFCGCAQPIDASAVNAVTAARTMAAAIDA